MATLKILFDASTAKRFPVYAQYPGQHSPQPAYLELDIRDGSLIADYSGEVGVVARKHNLSDLITSCFPDSD